MLLNSSLIFGPRMRDELCMGIIFLSNTMKRSSRVFSKKQLTKKQQLGHARGRSLEDHIWCSSEFYEKNLPN